MLPGLEPGPELEKKHMRVTGCQTPPQPQVPKAVGRDLLTLEPLRSYGPDALDTHGIKTLVRIRLIQVRITWNNTFHLVFTIEADDVFNSDPAYGSYDPIPETGIITSAVFEFQCADSPDTFTVEICLPDVIILAPGANAELVQQWLDKSPFANSPDPALPSTGPPDVQSMAIP